MVEESRGSFFVSVVCRGKIAFCRETTRIVEFMEQPVPVLISRTLRENKNRRKLETRVFLIYVNSSTI